MEINDLQDFYIDLDGDIKATVSDTTALFITKTNKLNSEYKVALDINEIKDAINKINPRFNVDIKPFRLYSLKHDVNGSLKSVKVFVDYTEHITDGGEIILKGIEFIDNKIYSDHYFIATPETVDKIIKENNLNYKVEKYDTHQPILYSIKYQLCVSDEDCVEGAMNFKTYYVKTEGAPLYNRDFANHLKEILKFF
jgi:hypothetical protein